MSIWVTEPLHIMWQNPSKELELPEMALLQHRLLQGNIVDANTEPPSPFREAPISVRVQHNKLTTLRKMSKFVM